MSVNTLKNIANALRKLDADLRQKTVCPTCGKPTSGIVPVGKTPQQVGLCLGHPEENSSEKIP